MRYIYFVILLLVSPFAQGQLLEGVVLDNETKEPIQGVTVIDKKSNIIVISDATGHYALQTLTGDTIVFSHTAYKPVTEVLLFSLGRRYKVILMEHSMHRLKETTVTGLTKYQEDSLKTREEYKQPMRQRPGEVKTYLGFGVATEGLISNLVGNITGYNQRQKKFKNTLIAEEHSKFIDTRYTTKLVHELTGLEGDSAANFMNTYHMSYEFARAATDLEIKMWIKHNYKDYLEKQHRK